MTLADSFIDELTREADTTRRVLERVPEEKLSWRPHTKSMSLGQMALHVAQVPGGVAELISETPRELPAFRQDEAASRAQCSRRSIGASPAPRQSSPRGATPG
jgi:uncharacterized damage-inducible protein DinB